MDAMPRPRPPHLQREVTRHGRAVWYVRVGKGPRIRVRSTMGSVDFEGEYRAAVAGTPQIRRGPSTGTVAWLLEQYRETAVWAGLAAATRRQRDNIFKHVLETAGSAPYAKVTPRDIEAGRERRAKTPSQARNYLDAMRGLFRWAKAAKHRKDDPTLGVMNPPRPKTGGFAKWTEEDGEAYERHWPLGTRQRVWFDVLCYIGGRRGDAHRVGRQHARNGVLTFQTEKSGNLVTVTIPILPVFQATLDAGPTGDLAYVIGKRGHPLTKESFGNAFSEAARAAGVKKSAHGVRKLAATRAANNGATVAQLNAIFGWTGSAMASLYTQEADRRRLGLEAAHMLANDDRTSIPAPELPVRGTERKA